MIESKAVLRRAYERLHAKDSGQTPYYCDIAVNTYGATDVKRDGGVDSGVRRVREERGAGEQPENTGGTPGTGAKISYRTWEKEC